MELEEMTTDEMKKAAESLAYCLAQGAFEDAANWVAQLAYALHRREVRERVRFQYGIEAILRATDPNQR